jgi:hypothetical protein
MMAVADSVQHKRANTLPARQAMGVVMYDTVQTTRLQDLYVPGNMEEA